MELWLRVSIGIQSRDGFLKVSEFASFCLPKWNTTKVNSLIWRANQTAKANPMKSNGMKRNRMAPHAMGMRATTRSPSRSPPGLPARRQMAELHLPLQENSPRRWFTALCIFALCVAWSQSSIQISNGDENRDGSSRANSKPRSRYLTGERGPEGAIQAP